MSDGINLRPWREEKRQQRQALFTQLCLLALVAGLLITALIWYSNNQSISAVKQENQLIKTQMTTLDQQIREVINLQRNHEQLLQRIQVIQKLQQDRPVTIEIMDQMTASLENGVYLTDIKRQSNQLTLTGLAQPPQVVPAWMRKLSQQPRFSEPVLRSLNTDTSNSAARFDLLLPLKEPTP
ncbi:MAG: PilN domain-containing protein [Marinospirillum sp.]|uniref:PilN domain-containing protein n=1 Tax=Marinospirillum sp. TaxID=2183934 RepID=UPI0019DF0152|nr:PilN domain-containing protein [Marinospirillum sp.]MBE0506327.1 PilN domain-containing protein [Marinospirillum sp.]